MRNRGVFLGAALILAVCGSPACKSRSAPAVAENADGGGSAASTASRETRVIPSAAPSFTAAPPAPWGARLQGLATSDGAKFGVAGCFTETKHCIQFPLGWKTDGRAQAMGDGRIAWAHAPNRHVCLAVDRGGSDWAELIRRDEAEQKGFSEPEPVKVGVDEIPGTIRAARFDMAHARPYPFHVLMWFACYGVDPEAAGNPAGMPPGPATLLVLRLDIKQGLTFNTYAFVSDAATDDEKRDLLATLRGIRTMPGKLGTHPK